MRFGSVCSGIEAASVGFSPLGWQAAFFSEVEKFPSAVLAHHYPDVPNHGDMTKFNEWGDYRGSIGLLCGGTPCQSFSIAGLRKGLDDARGNLSLTFGEMAAKFRPPWFLWENVPGVLSSGKGRDFGAFLGLLSGRSIPVPKGGWGKAGIIHGYGNAYGLAYRMFDAQYFGVAQRRRRVFVVGYLGDWRPAAAVLFERESLRGHPAPCREKGKGFTHDVAPSLTGSGRGVERGGDTRGQDPVVAGTLKSCGRSGGWSNSADHAAAGYTVPVQWPAEIAPTLNASFGDKQGLEDQHALSGGGCSYPTVAMCLNAGGMGRQDAESETLIPVSGGVFDDVAHTLKSEGHDASEDGTGRGVPLVVHGTQDPIIGHDQAHTLGRNSGQENAVLCLNPEQPQCWRVFDPTGINPSLQSGEGRGNAIIAIQERAICENPNAGPIGAGYRADGAAYTLEARTAPQAISRIISAVRRLIPVECERLQGFPDNYTRIPVKTGQRRDVDDAEDIEAMKAAGMEMRLKGNIWQAKDPDGPRYKALGNSWAVPNVAWIGKRIDMIEHIVSGERV